MIAPSTTRVERHSADSINREHQAEISRSLRYHAGRPDEIPARLAELDREWDIERALETTAATLSLAGFALAIGIDRRFLALPAAVAGFLLQHAIQGWCPPLPVLRRIGFRTPAEINAERCGLKMLGGEYAPVGEPAAVRWQEQSLEIHEAVEG